MVIEVIANIFREVITRTSKLRKKMRAQIR